ncbi:hypothetical protein BDF20DRAFT_836116 [Mycotypha africana]|uniref:uncharacterized protein n=1 Tax=Mycotypha africana TaxID=64632 RepID=UPI002301DBCF|nr:uncharacterized protein BDF20DRAFT_836116 [Mycotypha africana]KAI8977298.1 hypothetical protein BDF20DRAFT_836116 [Mycotypha africana]
MNNQTWSSDFFQECPYPVQQDYFSKFEVEHPSHTPTLVYPVSPFYTTSPSASPSSNIMYTNEPFITSPATFHLNPQQHYGPGSPDSLMSGFSANAPAAAVLATTTASGQHALPPPPAYQHPIAPPPLVQSHSSSTIHSTGSATTTVSTVGVVAAVTATTTAPPPPPPAAPLITATTTTPSAAAAAYLNETIAKASALPESFYPEFLQYSKESFEQSASQRNHGMSRKRARTATSNAEKEKKQSNANATSNASTSSSSDEDEDVGEEEEEEMDEEEGESRPSRKRKTDDHSTSVSELRRQIHIQSEQKRRAQIKDGFEDLRAELPTCLNKKMSKVNLLHKTVQHIKHLKSTQMTILAELERLVQENEQLRNFQQSVLQKQAFENMYAMGNI